MAGVEAQTEKLQVDMQASIEVFLSRMYLGSPKSDPSQAYDAKALALEGEKARLQVRVTELAGHLEMAEARARDAPQHHRLEFDSLQRDLAQFKQV